MPPFFAVGNSGRTTDVLSNTMVSRIFAGQNTGTGWTAYLAGGIAPGKFHPLVGNAVDVGSFVKSGALVGEVHCTEIVHQDKQYIWLLGQDAEWGKKKKKGKGLIHDLKAMGL